MVEGGPEALADVLPSGIFSSSDQKSSGMLPANKTNRERGAELKADGVGRCITTKQAVYQNYGRGYSSTNPIDSNDIIYWAGAIHCVTMTIGYEALSIDPLRCPTRPKRVVVCRRYHR